MTRVCILSPMALTAAILAGFCAGIAAIGVMAGIAGHIVMGGLVGLVAGIVLWRLGSEEPGGLILGLGAFWRPGHVAELDEPLTDHAWLVDAGGERTP